MEKYAARSVKQQIDRVLWEVWDPIGVNWDPIGKISPARDEYSGYLNGVLQLLTSAASDSRHRQHLLKIVHDRMELKAATVEDMQPTVTALRESAAVLILKIATDFVYSTASQWCR